jgi:mono/diheme cytochrome c family protein
MRASLLLVVLVAGCGAQRRGEPSAPPVQPTTVSEARGQRLFAQHCYSCHPGGEPGVGPALNDKPLPEAAIKTQIRKGVGAMPAFSSDELSDADVDAIADFVHAMRAAPASAAR